MSHLRGAIIEDDPDDKLWAACRAGSADAFDVIFRRHHGRVFLYCARLAGSMEDAEDATAETFIAIWRGRRKFATYNGSIAPILFAIAKRVVQKQHRSRSRRDAAHTRLRAAPMAQQADTDSQVLERLELNERLSWLASEVRKLPPPQRAVVHLCTFAEVSQSEAAGILQIPIGTVKSRLYQARSQLSAAADQLQPSQSIGVE